MKNISRIFVAACAAVACGMAGIGCWLAGNGNNDPSSAASLSQMSTSDLVSGQTTTFSYSSTEREYTMKAGRVYYFNAIGGGGGTGGSGVWTGYGLGAAGGRGSRAYGWYDMRNATGSVVILVSTGQLGGNGPKGPGNSTPNIAGGTFGGGRYAGGAGGGGGYSAGGGGAGGGASSIVLKDSLTPLVVAGGGGGGGGGSSTSWENYTNGTAGGGNNGLLSSNSTAQSGVGSLTYGRGGGGGGYSRAGGCGVYNYEGGGGGQSYLATSIESLTNSARGTVWANTGSTGNGSASITEYSSRHDVAAPNNGSGYTVQGPSVNLVNDSGSYTFTITTTLGYTNSVPHVTLTGNGTIDPTVAKNGNSYTFTVKNVTGTISPSNFTVTGVKKNKYSVTTPQSIENNYTFTLIDENEIVEHDGSYSFKLTLSAPYTNAQPVVNLDPAKGTIKLTNPTERIYTVENVQDTIVEKDFTVTISKNIYTINFDTRGGSSISSRQVTHGNKVTRPIDPMLTGYKLEGWYTSLFFDTEWNFSVDTATGPMTLYAKWVEGTPDPIIPGDDDPNLPGDDDPNLPGNDDPNPPGGDPDESNMIWFVLTGVFIPLALLAAFLALYFVRKKKAAEKTES